MWQASSPDQATGYNELLADVIAEGATAGASKATPQGAPIQDIPLRLALVGAPFAGKTSMALKLADDHGCKVCCNQIVWRLQTVKQQNSLSDLIHLLADTQLAGVVKLTVCN